MCKKKTEKEEEEEENRMTGMVVELGNQNYSKPFKKSFLILLDVR